MSALATKRQEQARQTKQRILDAAQVLIGEKGYLRVTVEEIAAAAGIGKGTMYHYFKGKEDILSYIERGKFEEAKAQVDTMAFASVSEKLRCFLSRWFACVEGDNLNLSKDWHRLAVDLKVPSAERRTHLDDDVDNLVRYLEEGIAAGEFSPDMPVEPIARDIVFSMYGASFYRCSTYTAFDLVAWSETFIRDALMLHIDPYRLKG